MEAKDRREQQRKTNAQYRAQLAAEVSRQQELIAVDDFFAKTELGFRPGKSACRKCGKPRTANEVATYGSLCEICWCTVLVTKKTSSRPMIRKAQRTLPEENKRTY